MNSYSTDDNDLQIETFEAKVLENDLIRLVLVPEYGGRVISFFHKPTNHEYLYQSECGSPYGIGDGNFYYDWLMVWGGIFPTFPEPEHGKTWFLPWDYSVIKNTADTITVRMEYTDDSMYAGAPGGFNNGITQITCRVDVSIYTNSSLWDYDVSLINNRAENINYEYWTCTTLAPGSEKGDTGTPLNSEIVVPVDKYIAGWSPGAWIGNFNGTYDISSIDYLSDWNNMGIAYAKELNSRYWGVINHENQEGIFRISDNAETEGMKLWTWGRDNIDNDMFDFSNGGADNYIELWAGVSNSFFTDATMTPNETKTWRESYCPTVGMTSIGDINEFAAVNLIWDELQNEISYELNTFQSDYSYDLSIKLEAENDVIIAEKQVSFNEFGQIDSYSLDGLELPFASYQVVLELRDDLDNVIISTSKTIETGIVTSYLDDERVINQMNIRGLGTSQVRLELPRVDDYQLVVMNINGKEILNKRFSNSSVDIQFPNGGLFIIQVASENELYTTKLFAR